MAPTSSIIPRISRTLSAYGILGVEKTDPGTVQAPSAFPGAAEKFLNGRQGRAKSPTGEILKFLKIRKLSPLVFLHLPSRSFGAPRPLLWRFGNFNF